MLTSKIFSYGVDLFSGASTRSKDKPLTAIVGRFAGITYGLRPRKTALLMRRSGAKYSEIANQLGVSSKRTRELVMRALRDEVRVRSGSRAWPSDEDFSTIGYKPRRARATGRLSDGQLQILELLALGLDNAEIATRMGFTRGTVAVYVSRLYAKFGTKRRASLSRLAKDLVDDSDQRAD